jgi:hypothetical protein
MNDPAHCGTCTNACAVGQICSGGMCACASGTLCSGACVNLMSDPNHCGSCTNACSGATPVCSGGMCVANCGALSQCGLACVNEQNDPNNCGGCGVKCGVGQQCAGGICCASSSVCGGQCVNLQNDNMHCGDCTTVCTAGSQTCQAGICCTLGTTNCGGVCRDLQTDPNNCNACGNVCSTGMCANGSCCGAGLTECGLQCVNTQSDPNNCGACFNVCPASTTCTSNNGKAACCGAGQTNCNGTCVDLTTNPNNCGACGNACTGGAFCSSSSCACGIYFSYCGPVGGKACIPTQVDPKNCGGCGITCGGTTPDCSNGKCVNACGPGLTACPAGSTAGAGSCRAVNEDPTACGANCIVCPANQGCFNGACSAEIGGLQFPGTSATICGASGLGPPITLSPSQPPRGTGGMPPPVCSGNLAATTFDFGVCACQNITWKGSSAIDAWDSTLGPYNVCPNANGCPTGVGFLGGSVGVNAAYTTSSTMSISGDLDGFSDMNTGSNLTVSEQFHCGGTHTGKISSGGLAQVEIPMGSGMVSTNPAFAANCPPGNVCDGMFVAPNPPNANTACGGYAITSGGCNQVNPWVAVQEPCKRCDAASQITTSAYIANYATQNDNALIGLTPAIRNTIATAATGVLVLPCGYYYLDAINVTGNFVVVATGNTALFVGGAINSGSGTTFTMGQVPGARLDVFVKGSVQLTGNNPAVGVSAYPASQRMYVACSTAGACTTGADCCSGTCTGSVCTGGVSAIEAHNPKLMIGGFYAPNGTLTTTSSPTVYGSIFAQNYDSGTGNISLHYDRAFASASSSCPPPTGGCGSCLDCANQACVAGQCGSCSNDGQCCAPLRCVNGTCVFTSF